MIPRSVVAAPVAILLAVGLVVAIVVADEIAQREPVVCGHEVDRTPRLAAAIVEQARRGAQHRRDRPSRRVAAPELANGVAEDVVPLAPAGRERTDLIAARPAVPRLR